MNMKIKNFFVGVASVAALAVAGAVFVPPTAEAHCGEHTGNCGGERDELNYTYCWEGTTQYAWIHWATWCNAPQPPGGPNAPCADCGGPCYQYDWYSQGGPC